MGAFDLLQHLRGAGLVLTADGERLTVTPRNRLTDDLRESIQAYKAELLAALAAPAHAHATDLDADAQHHPEAWPEPQLNPQDLMHARLIGMGLDAPQAAKLSEWMTLRNSHHDGEDDRVVCFECKHFRPTGRRCGNHLQAEMPRDLGRELSTLPQRCIGFREGRNLTARVHSDPKAAPSLTTSTKGNQT